MPLNVRRFGASCLVFLLLAGAVFAQATGSSVEDMQQRLARARAFVAVKSYTAAAFELEKIRKESGDPTVQNIALMLLMNCYLENSDYKRTQDLLTETFNTLKASKGTASSAYFTVSSQVIKMSRTQMDRYKQLGLNVADANMPAEVAAELEKMRGALELVVGQTKELSDSNKRSAEAFGLLEEVTSARSLMARDAYDSTRWKNEVADARERLSNAQKMVLNVEEPFTSTTAAVVQNNNTVAANTTNTAPVFNNISANANALPPPPPAVSQDTAKENKPAAHPVQVPVQAEEKKNTSSENNTAENKPMPTRARVSGDKGSQSENQAAANTAAANSGEPSPIGSLVEMATKKVAPVYPQLARNMRVTGVVKVNLVLDEQGSVVSAEAQGPEVLKRAATDAVKQWKFKPVVKDGQPTKASGFVNFNFSL